MRPVLLAALLLAALLPCALSAQDRPPRPGAGPISEAEIRASSAANAYDLVRALRPVWLQRALPGIPEPTVVYLGRARMGGPEALQDIPTAGVHSVRFLDPAEAQYLFGTGNSNGVIQVSMTAPLKSPGVAGGVPVRSRPALELMGGVPRPSGEGAFPDAHAPGASFALAYSHPLAPGLDLRVAVERHGFRQDDDGAYLAGRVGMDPATVRAEGGGMTVTGLSVGAKVRWGSSRLATPFFTGSVGRYRSEAPEIRLVSGADEHTFGAERGSGMGFALGGGVEVRAGTRFRLLAEAGFANVNANATPLSFTPLRLGVAVPLTR